MTDPAPTIWLLTDGQPGNLTQIEGLAAHLPDQGANVQVKRLRSNRWHMLGAALLGASGLSIDRHRSDALVAPWPDMVIGTGRRSAPWVRHVKRFERRAGAGGAVRPEGGEPDGGPRPRVCCQATGACRPIHAARRF